MLKNYKNCRNSICHLVLALARVSSEWLKISDCEITEIINLAKPGRKQRNTAWTEKIELLVFRTAAQLKSSNFLNNQAFFKL
jgi:hypothetical protein